jgi:hypothetical protein
MILKNTKKVNFSKNYERISKNQNNTKKIFVHLNSLCDRKFLFIKAKYLHNRFALWLNECLVSF